MKNSQNNENAFKLFEIFLRVFAKLTRDEIFFWSRSEEKLKILLIETPNNHTEILVGKKDVVYGNMHAIDVSPDKTLFDLLKSISKLFYDLTPEQILFWLDSEEILYFVLRKGEVCFLKEVFKNTKIRELAKEAMNLVINGVPFRMDWRSLRDAKAILKNTYQSTEASEATSYEVACDLRASEVVSFIGGRELLYNSCFTPQQIRQLALKQRKGDTPGPLVYSGKNYFPIEVKDGSIGIFCVSWSSGTLSGTSQKEYRDKWRYWVFQADWTLETNGRFFISG